MVIRGLPDAVKRELQIRSDAQGLRHFLLHIGLILVLALIVAQGGIARVIAIVPLGISLILSLIHI